MMYRPVLLATFLLLINSNNGLKIDKVVKESCTVLTDQGTVDLTSVAKTPDENGTA